MNRLTSLIFSRTGLVLLAAATLPACAWLLGSWGGGNPARHIRDNMIFSHNKHVEVEGLACTDCHDAIEKNTSLDVQRGIPTESKCMDCHDKTEGQCGKCHANPEMPTTWVDTRMSDLRFDHKAHIERVGKAGDKDTCSRCHADVRTHKKVSEDRRPQMFATCAQCHSKDFGADKCAMCHSKLTSATAKPIKDFDHGADWLRRHGVVAKGGMAVCGHCHQESSCTECHGKNNPIRAELLHLDRVDAAFHHRGDFLTRHTIEAKSDPKACLTCHTQNNCVACHEKMGLSKTTPGGANPHPAGWMERGGADNHGKAARRDILACAACHDRGGASNCVKCHKVGEPGGNPHPPGWSSSQDKASAPACTPCHL